MAEVVFFLAALGALAGAVGTVTLRNPFYSVLALVAHLLSLALLFLLLRAEFVAAAQVVVYAGAVMVLYMFVVAYVGGTDIQVGPANSRATVAGAVLFGFVLFVELTIAVLGTGLKALGTEGVGIGADGVAKAGDAGFGTPEQIGELLLTKFLLPFEVASFLLLIAAVGAVTLARRRGGLGDPAGTTITPLDLARPRSTGTMAEAVGGQRRITRREQEQDGVEAGVTSTGLNEQSEEQ